MVNKKSPYSWTTSTPQRPVVRTALIARVVDHLDHDEGTVVLGARGMGKSVFLAQLGQELKTHRDVEVVSFAKPPDEKTVRNAVTMMADALAITAKAHRPTTQLDERLHRLGETGQIDDILKAYLGEVSDEVERLVLIFDEVDQYADPPAFGRAFFNSLEGSRKLLDGQLVFVVAGGLKLLTLDTELGSVFFTRMKNEVVEPLDRDDLVKMAVPFAERDTPLSVETLDRLLMTSGGNALLATYGLRYLWDREAPAEQDVLDIFHDFAEKERKIYRDIKNAVAGVGVAGVPFQVLQAINRNRGLVSADEIDRICAGLTDVATPLEREDVLEILRASGLVRVDSYVSGPDRIAAHVIPSVISFRLLAAQTTCDGIAAQLLHDVQAALLDMQSMTPSFYRPADKEPSTVGDGAKAKNKKRKPDDKLVPEGTLAATLVVGLSPRGWRCVVESQSGRGYADIKARHSRFGEEEAVVEVKIWPRNDYKDIHEQVTDYFTAGVRAFATVMIGDIKDADWKDKFAKACLDGKVDQHVWRPLPPPLEGYFEARKGPHTVHHFLLNLGRR